MKDIKCPSCGKTFRIDPSSFQEILLQIKDEEFNKQIEERLKLAEEDKNKGIEIAKQELKIKLMEDRQKKDTKIQDLESKLNIAEEKKLNALNELKNKATNKINLLNNEVIKLKEDIERQSVISDLSSKNKVIEAVNSLEKEKTFLQTNMNKYQYNVLNNLSASIQGKSSFISMGDDALRTLEIVNMIEKGEVN